MTTISFQKGVFKRKVSLDVLTEIGGREYKDFIEHFEEDAPDEIKQIFKEVEENIGFDTLEAIFLRSLDKECKLNIVDKGQLHYLFWHEIEETFENCEKQIAQQVIDIDYVLKTTPHHIDTNLDSIKYQSIGNKFDIKGDIPLYYQILGGVKSLIDISKAKKPVNYTAKEIKLPISKFKWLFFLLLMTKHSIFLYRDEFSKKLIHQITNHHIMHEQFYIDVYAINIEMVLEIIFTLAKGVYPEIRQHIQKIIIRNFELSREYSKWFNDMFASRAISEEFMNANIQGKMIDGKPYFFEVIAKTRDTNIRNRKEILGPNREITEKTEGGKAQSLTITKKYKYGNKKQKK